MTDKTDRKAAVLGVFLAYPDQEHYGLEIAEAAGLKPGSIYAELAWLERVGWVTSGWAHVDAHGEHAHRRYYKLTPAGAEADAGDTS